ncbi:PRC-barrel domain-containing protein [Teichococcus aestuarii]|uniref:PRC-barrel domain protein n=1 Tax=Teichococcus aestuarii TaxID=568898 RepID=A0A2U1V9S8_9PROT|nr:PRC-barrel domain-containing protein [Pseudoroseomonas aestuarii]PWC30667.1 PRC-barrel domain protein [Pseudoroseomonas aestuarii]
MSEPIQNQPGAAARQDRAALIASDRVEGTAVYDTSGNRLGSIDTLMIDKVQGRVEYAVLSFGGFLGFGGSHFPLPWNQLRYDVGLGGYVVDVTEEQLADAPSYKAGETVDWSDELWSGRVRGYYGPSPYGSRDGL